MSNICKHINEHTGLHLIPGKHVAIELKDGSRMVDNNFDYFNILLLIYDVK